ncbi:beta-1,4-galactosyltransferase 2-like [Symphorus nematophorus]
MVKEHVQDLWEMTTGDPKASQEATQMPAPTNKTLGPCPETPPKLVGPLHVDFNYNRILDKVRKEIGSPLQEGGRYKPPDCISRQKVAIIIPFRNRHEHLNHWLYYLHPILIRQQLDYGVYVINQDGEGVFNRAKLMNAGYAEALKEYDYDCFVFSDIDLVPMDDRNLYRCFDNPRHLAVAMDKFKFQLPYKTFFGGVSSLSKDHFLKINGFPNTYWGWGGEDDDIYRRITYHGMSVSRPDLVMGKYKMIKHVRDKHNEANPVNPGKLSQTKWTMDKDGINSLKYTVKEIVKDILYTFITVDIDAPPS